MRSPLRTLASPYARLFMRSPLCYAPYISQSSLLCSSHVFSFRFFKDELKGKSLKRFVGLRSKAYAMEIIDKHEKQTKIKCKGIARAYRDRIKFENFLCCINNTAKIKTQMRTIRAKNNLLKIINQNKTAVSSFDDKRY